MPHPILGLHHVTATVDDAQADLDFCLESLGLRLVKKTVNFDNHNVYHFYYGDELGTPGTLWTTFPYRGHGVRVGTKGAGQVVSTSFSVPEGSLDAWTERLGSQGVDARRLAARFGEEVIALADPSGHSFELVANDRDHRRPWTGRLNAELAIRGLHSVTLKVRQPEGTIALMTSVLGYQVIDEAGSRTRLAVNGEVPGHLVDLVADPDADAAVNGIGTVHHVAMAVDSNDEQRRLREELVSMGLNVTPVLDRSYFRSIYFREPGGVLFEVATMRPGFTRDEAPETLGRELKLPEWEEPQREAIEARLAQVTY